MSDEQVIDAANAYFEQCYDEGRIPLLSEFALAIGLPGVSSLYRLARRRPKLAAPISRCLTVIAAHYESQITEPGASRGAIFILKHIKDFDLFEGAGAPELTFWTDKQELVVSGEIAGIIRKEDKGKDLTPEEAYLQILKGGTLARAQPVTLDDEPEPAPAPSAEALFATLQGLTKADTTIEDATIVDTPTQ